MALSGYTPYEVVPLHPPPSYSSIRHLQKYVYERRSDKDFRKIFHCVHYEQHEDPAVEAFEKAVADMGLALPDE